MKDWRFWLGIIISLIFIALALFKVEAWNGFYNSLLQADYTYIIPAIGGFFLILVVRTFRWRYIIHSVGRVNLWRTFVAMNICYMGNNIFPFRAGELLRVWVLGRREDVPMSSILATVVVERLFDFITLLISMAVLLLIFSFPEEYKHLESALHKGGLLALVAVGGLLVFLYLLFAFTETMMKVVDFFLRFVPQRWAGKLRELTLSFA